MTYSLTLPTITAVDSLDHYLRSIKSIPVLSAEEEFEYARRLKNENDLNAAKALIMSHLRLVASIARGYAGYGLPQADLIQEGNIGLMKAVKKFDPERGVRLVSFAIHWIKAEIHEYIVRNWRLVKIATTKAQRKLFFNLRSLKQGPGALQPDEVQMIARELKVKPEEVTEMETRLFGQEVSLYGNSDDDADEHYSPIAYLADEQPEPSQLLSDLEQQELHSTGLANALAALDDRSRDIVQARWLQSEQAATLHDLADKYGVSAERIRQIEQKAMEKIKLALTAN